MRCDFTRLKRREFLKKGMLPGALILFIWGGSLFASNKSHTGGPGKGSGGTDDRFLKMTHKYGGEFGNVKPEERRQGHGRV